MIRNAGKYLFNQAEKAFSGAFPGELNPLYHLGTLSFFLFWIVAGTGLYIFVFFETSIAGAYDSVEYLSVEQWYLGGVMRSLHRYASAAMSLTVTLHLLREFVMGRYQGVRFFSWVSGVPLLWLLFASAIGGYWLVWDQLAQYIAILSSEWFDWLPVIVDPMARNFLNEEAMGDRLFSLLVFLHIGVPLTLLLGMFIHIQRISYAKTTPPRELAVGTLIALLVLSLVKPAMSQARADLDRSITEVGLDWFYLNFYPLIDAWGPGPVWIMLGAITLLLTALPWLSPHRPKPVAEVDPANCNGCGWCLADCPYSAVVMKVHDYKKGHRQSVVDPNLCIGCGICAGACPSATPFRHVDELVSGIDIPDFKVKELLARTEQAVAGLEGDTRILIYGCEFGTDISALDSSSVATINLPCIGLLPPSFIDYIYRNHKADGVMISGCCEGDCHYRLGNTWVEQRFASERMPHLRTSDAKANLKVVWAGPLGKAHLAKELEGYQSELARRLSTLPEPAQEGEA